MRWIVRLIVLRWASGGRGAGFLRELALENLALRQQVALLQRTSTRLCIRKRDRLFWVTLSRLWPEWKSVCQIMRPSTVVAWHRAGFRMFWSWTSRHAKRRRGRPSVNQEVRSLIRRMAQDNPFWGAPRIHGELAKLGFRVSERSVQRWMPRRPKDPKRAQAWRAFLDNHREVIAAMDFCVVPTAAFGLLYVLVIVEHGRRIVQHLNVTSHPTAEWVKAQLKEAFPFDEAPRYLLFDRDSTFTAVKGFIEAMGILPKPIAFRSPWQNGVCERLIGTLRREVLDHVISLNEAHLRRLLKDYLRYYHEDRTHLGLAKDSPRGRSPNARPCNEAQVIAHPRVGGLHHRYQWDRAA